MKGKMNLVKGDVVVLVVHLLIVEVDNVWQGKGRLDGREQTEVGTEHGRHTQKKKKEGEKKQHRRQTKTVLAILMNTKPPKKKKN
jgi:hypothetical protein